MTGNPKTANLTPSNVDNTKGRGLLVVGLNRHEPSRVTLEVVVAIARTRDAEIVLAQVAELSESAEFFAWSPSALVQRYRETLNGLVVLGSHGRRFSDTAHRSSPS